MNGRRQSDKSVVPAKPANNDGTAAAPSAERVEGRELPKGNLQERTRLRAQHRDSLQSALERIRQAAERDRKMQFTTLWHHVYNVDRLREAYLGLKRNAAPGVDRVTWRVYGEQLEENLQDLAGRLKRGAYRAQPVKRSYIPKEDGRQRPLGVTALEDKVAQRSSVEVLNAIYEADFLGFSYGFRPGRSPHMALDALAVGIERRRVNWVLDADIRGFYDAINHEWLLRFIEYYGVPRNGPALCAFRYLLVRLWWRSLLRRRQRRTSRTRRARFKRWVGEFLPYARIFHPYPAQRLCVTT